MISYTMALELNGDEKKINYVLETDILRYSSLKILGVLRGAFLGFGCPKRHPDALLAKTLSIHSTGLWVYFSFLGSLDGEIWRYLHLIMNLLTI